MLMIVYEDLQKARYAEDWETNTSTWELTIPLCELTNGVLTATKHWIAYTDSSGMFIPAKTESTNKTATVPEVFPGTTTSCGWQGNVSGKVWNTKINFIPKGNQNGTNTIKRLYQVSAWVINEDTNEPVPYTNITVLGKTLDTNGIAHVVLDEASTNSATPSVTGVSNYYFNVSATRIMLEISFQGSGDLVDPDWYGIGYYSVDWDYISSKYGTALGPGATTNGSLVFNLVQLAAVIPGDMPKTGWSWHRDVARRTYLWNSTTKVVSQIFTNANLDFTGIRGFSWLSSRWGWKSF